MKKFLAVLLTATVGFVMAGCNQAPAATTAAATTAAATTTTAAPAGDYILSDRRRTVPSRADRLPVRCR